MAIDVKSLPAQPPTTTKQAEIDAIVQGHISFMVTPHDHAHNCNGCGAPCPICQQQGQNGACKLASKHPGDHVCNVNSNHTWANDGIPGPHP